MIRRQEAAACLQTVQLRARPAVLLTKFVYSVLCPIAASVLNLDVSADPLSTRLQKHLPATAATATEVPMVR